MGQGASQSASQSSVDTLSSDLRGLQSTTNNLFKAVSDGQTSNHSITTQQTTDIQNIITDQFGFMKEEICPESYTFYSDATYVYSGSTSFTGNNVCIKPATKMYTLVNNSTTDGIPTQYICDNDSNIFKADSIGQVNFKAYCAIRQSTYKVGQCGLYNYKIDPITNIAYCDYSQKRDTTFNSK